MKYLLLLFILLTALAFAHGGQMFKDKSYGFESFADTYSVSIYSNNVLEINRNGNTVFTEKNFCELKPH